LKIIGYGNPDNNIESHYIITMINSSRIRWSAHVAQMRANRNTYRNFVAKVDLNVDMTILKYILNKWDGDLWIGFIWLRIGASGKFCEHGNKASGSIKCWQMLQWLSGWWFLKDSALHKPDNWNAALVSNYAGFVRAN
jgi:hypothetical protein